MYRYFVSCICWGIVNNVFIAAEKMAAGEKEKRSRKKGKTGSASL